MKEKLSQNLGLRAISVVLAFVIWLMVVNISQPEVTGTQTVEIKVQNADRLTAADKTYKMDTRSVRVSYRVRLPQQGKLSADDFHAYVDLADYSVTGAVPVYVDVDDSVSGLISNISLNPMVVHVETEDIQRKRFDMATATIGKTMDGYIAGEISIEPTYVYVTGPVSEVGQISEVGIEVDVSEANSALRGSAPVHFYDANGNPITLDDRVSISREEVDYELPIYRIKSLSIVAEASGTPAEGYVLDSVEASPGFADVYGDEDVLSQYTSIHIPDTEISVNGASATVTRNLNIVDFLPEGLKLAQPGTEITVAARIRKLPETTEAPQESSASHVLIPEETLPLEGGIGLEEESSTAETPEETVLHSSAAHPQKGTENEESSAEEKPESADPAASAEHAERDEVGRTGQQE